MGELGLVLDTEWPQAIRDVDGVRAWFRQLLAQGCNFHPDDPAAGMISLATGRPVFTAAIAARYDALMAQAFSSCDDVYQIACDELADYIRAHTAQSN